MSGAPSKWLFSRRVDLGVFLGSAALSFAALAVGGALGILHDDTPGWVWVPAIMLCDVAHVWSTIFRTYFDPEERKNRRVLFSVVPIVGLAASVALFAWRGPADFWRVLAYLAIFHFVRQQYGWVALYRAKNGEPRDVGYWVDTIAIYAATLYPLFYWHTHVPRRFAWFVQGDIVALPTFVRSVGLPIATVLWALALLVYAARALRMHLRGRGNTGKDVVVATTALTWFVGIVAFDSDYAFTVTNVVTHGVPYFALVFFHARARAKARAKETPAAAPSLGARLVATLPRYLAFLWLIAFVEELFWDRAVWHDRGWLFGESWDLASFQLLIVPLLTLPQLTHYVLDGFIWRRRSNPSVAALASRHALDVEPMAA